MNENVGTTNHRSNSDDYELSLAIEQSLAQQRQEQKKAMQQIHFENASRNLALQLHYEEQKKEEEDNFITSNTTIQTEELELSKVLEESIATKKIQEKTIKMNQSAIDWQIQRSRDSNQGSWDCGQCTFTNDPYQRKCAMCGRNAPPNVLVFKPIPNCRFGVEIEIIVPRGKHDGFTLESIARHLTQRSSEEKTNGPNIPVHYAGYTHETSDCWKIVTDSSIRETNQNQDLCFELVSPILCGEAGLLSMRTVMDHIRELGVETNTSCGFHVHVDAEEPVNCGNGGEIGRLQGLIRISQCFVALENAFDLLVELSSWKDYNTNNPPTTVDSSTTTQRAANANKYCRSNRLAFGSKSNKQRWNEISTATTKKKLVQIINPRKDRYRKLNLTNITNNQRPSTCEFRQHGGVEDLQEAEAWVRLILTFCVNAAQNGRKSEACLLPEGSSPKAELRALFDLVDCDGLEQFFAVDRRLFRPLKNEWQCPVCRKRFRHSRSLAQHAAACGH